MAGRKRFIATALTLLAAGAAAGTAGAAETVRLYVAPGGNDSWSGIMPGPRADGGDGPLATLQGARDRLRRLKNEGRPVRGAVVEIQGGDYVLEETFGLSAADSGEPDNPLIYAAAAGQKVRILGGRRVTGFKPVEDPAVRARLAPEAAGHIVATDLRAQGITDFGEVVAGGRRLDVFFNNERLTLARWPDDDFARIKEVVGGEPLTAHGFSGDKIGKFTYEGDRPGRWTGEPEIWLQGYWFWDWADGHQRVESIDTAAGVITLAPPHHHYGYRAGQRWLARNLLCELDRPGEWYLDRSTGMLYLWPPGPVGEAQVWVSHLADLIRLDQASWITLRGLTLAFNRHTAVTINGGKNVTLAGCTIHGSGSRAVCISGGRDHGVVGCDIDDIADSAVSLDGGDRRTLEPGGNAVLNCHIRRFGRFSRTYCPAVGVAGVGNRVANNLMHDAPHIAVMLSGNEHVIELNEIHHVCMETDDAGAFYMGRDWTQRGNIVRYNYFHDIGRFSSWVGVQSVYLDDWTSGTTVFGNLIVRGARGVLVGGGRNNTIENNVFVDCAPAVHIDSRGLGWAKCYFDGRDNTLIARLEAMDYRKPPYSIRYPELLTLYDDEPALAKYNRVVRNICVGGRWLDLVDGLNDRIVEIRDNLVDQDPLFVDAARGDYRLRPDSPALALGFKPIPLERIGLYADPYRASVPPVASAPAQ